MSTTAVMTSKPSAVRGNPPRMLAVLVGLLAALFIVLSSGAAIAQDTSAEAQSKLTTYVQSNMAGQKYEADGGGSVSGEQLFQKNSQTDTYELNDYAYGKLSKDGQNAFAEDVLTNSQKAADEAERTNSPATSGINNDTVANYIQGMQENPGFTTKSMQLVLSGIQPDYIQANNIIDPWKPAFNVILAVLVVITFLAVLLSWAWDFFYITVPFVHNRIENSNGESATGKFAGAMVSPAAKKAVEEAQENGKSPLLGYLKKTLVQSFLMAVVLVLLVSGKIFIVGAMLLDLLAGVFVS